MPVNGRQRRHDAHLATARIEDMPVAQRALHHLAVEGDVGLAHFLAGRARNPVVVVHGLQIVHPRKSRLHVQRQHVLLRRLVVHVQADVLSRGLLRRVNQLVQATSRLHDASV